MKQEWFGTTDQHGRVPVSAERLRKYYYVADELLPAIPAIRNPESAPGYQAVQPRDPYAELRSRDNVDEY